MKKTFLLSIALSATFLASADYVGEGYYRLQNFKTERWASVVDDKGSVDYAGTTADLQAVRVQKNFNEVCCDPATVIYIRPHGDLFNIEAQGTSTQKLMDRFLNMREAGVGADGKLYYATGTQSGVEKYVGDPTPYSGTDVSYVGTNAKGDRRKWYVKPMETDGANFFGVRPTITVGDKMYSTQLASFSFKPYSAGVKVYAITGVHKDMALMEEITGVVPKDTPVVFEVTSETPSDNRLAIGGEGSAISSNKLSGVYFCFTDVATHLNFLKYNPATMRVLGKCSDGSLGFIVDPELEYIPKNTCYLTVAADAPTEIKIVDRATYDAGVDGVPVEDLDAKADVYNAHGMLILRNATRDAVNSLPAGLYIHGGEKILVK